LIVHVCQERRRSAIQINPPIERTVITLALVKLRDSEAFEQAFRRFKKACEKSGILSEVKKREHYEKPSVRLKKKSISARKRLLKKAKKSWGDRERD
jgi:small subunit ribosomal protein S21